MNDQGVVQEMGQTAKGSPKVKIDGKWYYPGRTPVGEMAVGMKIRFKSNVFGDKNNMLGLQEWEPITNGAAQSLPQQPLSAPSALDDADRPFISNIVAHAIAAGLIKEPEAIEKWAVAAQSAMRRLKGEVQHGLNGAPDEGQIPYAHPDDRGW